MVLRRVWHVCKYLSTNCRVIVKLVKVQLTSVCRQAGVFHKKLLTEEVCNWLATTCQLVGEYRFLLKSPVFFLDDPEGPFTLDAAYAALTAS